MFLGVYASAGLNRRAAALEQSGRLVSRVASRIRYTAQPVGEIFFEVSGEFAGLRFLPELLRALQEGTDFPSAWRQALEAKGTEYGLNGKDRELLLGYGEGLGKTDVEGQMEHCRLYETLIGEQLEEARREASVKGRLYITLGTASGLGVALLLL